MGNSKTPLTWPQEFTFQGIFEPDVVYSQLKDFLEVSKNYDLSENDIREKRENTFFKIDSKYSAEMHATETMDFFMMIETVLQGEDQVVVDNNGVEHMYINGQAYLKIYSFLSVNDHKHAHKHPLIIFFNRVYNKYFNTTEMGMLKKKAESDVKDTIAKFKQLVNMKAK